MRMSDEAGKRLRKELGEVGIELPISHKVIADGIAAFGGHYGRCPKCGTEETLVLDGECGHCGELPTKEHP